MKTSEQTPSASYYRDLIEILEQALETLCRTQRDLMDNKNLSMSMLTYSSARAAYSTLYRAKIEIELIALWYDEKEKEEAGKEQQCKTKR